MKKTILIMSLSIGFFSETLYGQDDIANIYADMEDARTNEINQQPQLWQNERPIWPYYPTGIWRK